MLQVLSKKGRTINIRRANRTLFAILLLLLPVSIFSIVLVATLSARPAVQAQSDYEEYFYSVLPNTYDIDVDGYEDSVSVEMDVDTSGGWVDIEVDGYLEDAYGYTVDSDFTSTSIYDEETDYCYIYLTVTSGDPGYYTCYLDLFDDIGYWEDTWSDSFYLYPMGYGREPIITSAPTPYQGATPYQAPTPTPTRSPGGGGGLNGGAVGGIIAGALIVVITPGLLLVNRNRKRKKSLNAMIKGLKAQMERWRDEGYDVSELEDLFR